MNHLIFSDLHANLFALEYIIRFAKEKNIHSFWCLGDVIGYHSYPNECLNIIQEYQIPTVKGNHEALLLEEMAGFSRLPVKVQHSLRVTRKVLRADYWDFIKDFPFLLPFRNGSVLLHANFWDLKQTVNSTEKAHKQFQEMKKRGITRLFFGHTHRPEIYVADQALNDVQRLNQFDQLANVQLKKDYLYLINPGSAGVARHKLPLSFIIYDDDRDEVSYYPIELQQEELKELERHNRAIMGAIPLQLLPTWAFQKIRKWYYRLGK